MASEGSHNYGDLGPDPFAPATQRRASIFDSHLLNQGSIPISNPQTAKIALQEHLAETDRRIEDASRLGTTLVQQRKELSERLREVENTANPEEGLSEELKMKLNDIEREFNEVGRDSARVFAPKSRASSSEMSGLSPNPHDKRSISPSKFESQATASPSKLSVPNRKQRNQPSNRVHDIEFATEISTSLLTQVRHLQALLAEKEDTIKSVNHEKARLEAEAESYQHRLRALDESESRYKDENWNLETQIHEHLANLKEAADREKKLTQALTLAQAAQANNQKELDEIKLSHSKLQDKHEAAVRSHDVEIGGLKRTVAVLEDERGLMQVKNEDLKGQNKELAMAIARQRQIADDSVAATTNDEDFVTADDQNTPDASPPPSPVKNTPRHSHLEAETMKSSLQHAHRMIQSLKGNIHREKTEKLELKRMLQDARDELEVRRIEGPAPRSRKSTNKEFKKPYKPNQLGGLRNSRTELVDDQQWEDDEDEVSPTKSGHSSFNSSFGSYNSRVGATGMPGGYNTSDQFDMTTDNTDAFETANEHGATETEDFMTTQENGSSDDLTETEGNQQSTIRMRRPPPGLAIVQPRRNSLNSTASLSGDEYSYGEVKTPKQGNKPRSLLSRMNRNRADSLTPSFNSLENSPAAFSSSNATPQRGPSQSLFAELGQLGSDDESFVGDGSSLNERTPKTPMHEVQRELAPPLPSSGLLQAFSQTPQVQKPVMVDSGIMTDAWEPEPTIIYREQERPASLALSETDADRLAPLSAGAGVKDNRFSTMSMMSNTSTQPGDIAERIAAFPVPPTSQPEPLAFSNVETQDFEPISPESAPKPALSLSGVLASFTEPVAAIARPKTPVRLELAPIQEVEFSPIETVLRPATPVQLAFAPVEQVLNVEPLERPATPPQMLKYVSDTSTAVGIEPIEPVARPVTPPQLSYAHLRAMETEPVEPVARPVTPPRLGYAQFGAVETEPVSPVPRPKTPVQFAMSSINATEVEPVEPVARPATPPQLGYAQFGAVETEPVEPVTRPKTLVQFGFSGIQSTEVEPVEPFVRPQTPVQLGVSGIRGTEVIPIAPTPMTPTKLAYSGINAASIEPVSPKLPTMTPIHLNMPGAMPETPFEEPAKLSISDINATEVTPVAPVPRPKTPVKLGMAVGGFTDVEPLESVIRPVTPPRFAFVAGEGAEIEPVEPVARPVTPPKFAFVSGPGAETEPVEPVEPVKRPVTPVKLGMWTGGVTEFTPREPVKRPVTPTKLGMATGSVLETEPITPVASPITPPRPVTPVILSFSALAEVDTVPITPPPVEKPAPIFVSQDLERDIKQESPETPKGFLGKVAKFSRELTPMGAFIAEDETRQSPNASPTAETPESQRPFKEITGNSPEKPKKAPILLTDSLAQTMLTSEQIDAMFKSKAQKRRDSAASQDARTMSPPPRAGAIPVALRNKKSQESLSSVIRRDRVKSGESDTENEPVYRRPESSQRRSSFNSHPPLPPNHQQAIAAARTGSGQSNKPGLMGPPLLPASASLRNQHAGPYRPRTPVSAHSYVPASPRNGTTPRPNYSSSSAAQAEMRDMANILGTTRSRASSVTSFASEIDTRFNLRSSDMNSAFGGTGTDPRMIQAITQTMIGEYLWKYTRKPGRSEFSETRHRRYFWVHPYTRTLYWSDKDPVTRGKGGGMWGGNEKGMKGVQIEAVRVVSDDNPLPPGLHRKSLVVLTPGRSVKFTAQTGQRHETWFNALSYLLLRQDGMNDSEEVAGGLTKEDVDEFNPSIVTSRSQSRTRNHGPPSLSSFKSNTTNNGPPVTRPKMSYDPAPHPPRASMVSRLSNYWGTGKGRDRSVSSLGGRRSRASERRDEVYGGGSMRSASVVHDSAESLREQIERAERESDRLENVRACCDGKHDVGHLSHTPNSGKKSRLNITPSRSGRHTPGPGGRNGAVSRQSIPE